LPVLAALILLATPAAAQTVIADFNGDGVRDRVDPCRGCADVVVRASNGTQIQRLHAHHPVVGLVVADVNDDGTPDIIVRTDRPGLHVWVNRGRGRFVRTRGRPLPSHGARLSRGSMTPRAPDADAIAASNADPSPFLKPDVVAAVRGVWTTGPFRRPRAPAAHFRIRPRAPRGPPPVLLFS
jgi:hypothetical protein